MSEAKKSDFTKPVRKGQCLLAIGEEWREMEIPEDDRHRPDGWVELPTGLLPYYSREELPSGIDIPLCCWILHAYRYQLVNNPSKFHLVGATSPF